MKWFVLIIFTRYNTENNKNYYDCKSCRPVISSVFFYAIYKNIKFVDTRT